MTPTPVALFGTTFQNPVLLAAGTCGFGRELAGVIDLERLGGIVTKSITLAPRAGNAAPRVAEFDAGMLNSIGLANPGMERARDEHLPWLARNLRRARVVVSVAGHTVDEYIHLVRGLQAAEGFVAFEVNLSCPNDDRLGGRPFSLDQEALADVLTGCRAETDRPLIAKLAPNDPDLVETARAAVAAGADGLTLINTLPGCLLEPTIGRPRIGAGQGGVSGPALRPVGVQAVRAVTGAVAVPVIGVGGITRADHALEYLHAGACLVQVGTASFAAPRAAERIVRALARRPLPPGRDGSSGARAGSNPSPAPFPDPV